MAFGDGKGWVFLLAFIPYIGWMLGLVFLFKLAKSFGKHIGYTLGLIFFQPIFALIIGLSENIYYEGPY